MIFSGEPADVELPLSDKQAIDRVCLDFEDHWRGDETPRLEEYLDAYDGSRRAVLLRELLLVELAYLRNRGEQPSRAEYIERFSSDTGIVSAVFLPIDAGQAPIYEAATQVGPYCIERLLGSGSFGEVYLATDTAHRRQVAIKVPADHRFTSPDAIEHFLDEARTSAKLDHASIVRALDVLRDDDGRPLIVMQFIDGQSLRERLDSGRVSRDDAIRWLTQLAEAIDYAHRQGIVHRDLEPRNILIDANDHPHISDFGLAIDEQSQETRAGESAGSLAYMSPEQIRGESHWLDGRADIWALGVILYELITGRRPFAGRDVEQLADQILYREAKPLRQIKGEIPAELERVCLKCLNKAIAHRYATAQDLADDLERFHRLPNSGGSEHSEAANARFRIAAFSASSPEGNTVISVLLGTLLAGLVLGALALGFNSGARRSPLPDGISKPRETATTEVAKSAVVVEDITIVVWMPQGDVDRRRGEINKVESSAAPLQLGDKIRLSVVISEPSFAYILWLDPDGELLPIYPWTNGDWQSRPDEEIRVDRIDLPSPLETWSIEAGEAGAATLFVFAGRERLDAETNVASLLPECTPQIGEPLARAFWFENGKEVRSTARQTRAPGLANPSPLADPVLLNQRLIFQHLGHYFDGNAAICVPIEMD